MNTIWSKDVVQVFIAEYEKHPCLYSVTSADYKNKIKKLRAITSIAAELGQKCGVTVSIDDIKKKIHGLKTQYGNELKKIKASKPTGTGGDDVYVPSLWCFDLLHFLNDHAYPQRTGESNMEAIEVCSAVAVVA